MKYVDLGENRYHSLSMYLCVVLKDIVDNKRNMFESRISAGATEKLPVSEKLDVNVFSRFFGIPTVLFSLLFSARVQ